MFKDDVFDILDDWDDTVISIRENSKETAIDLADELGCTFENAQELVSEWLEWVRRNP